MIASLSRLRMPSRRQSRTSNFVEIRRSVDRSAGTRAGVKGDPLMLAMAAPDTILFEEAAESGLAGVDAMLFL
jgi:hypothetical protein